jgi:hypothetical protein
MMPTRAGLIALATFPGVVMHEWAHKKFCDWFGVKVHNVAYFRFQSLFATRNGPIGYVVHAEPYKFLHAFWISVGPLIINSVLAILFGYIATRIAHGALMRMTFYWLAISIGAHAFPSNQDAKNVLQRSQTHLANKDSLLHYLSYPFFGMIWLANKLRRWWADFAYAALLVNIGSHL